VVRDGAEKRAVTPLIFSTRPGTRPSSNVLAQKRSTRGIQSAVAGKQLGIMHLEHAAAPSRTAVTT